MWFMTEDDIKRVTTIISLSVHYIQINVNLSSQSYKARIILIHLFLLIL